MLSVPQRLPLHWQTTNAKSPVRALVAAESIIARGGLCLALGTLDDIEVVGTATNGIELLEKAGMLQPDLVVSELTIPRLSGLACASQLRHTMPDVRIILLLMDSNGKVTPEMCLKAGADSCMRRHQLPEGLLSEIRALFLAK